MSLDFRLDKIKDYEDLCWTENSNGKYELAWKTDKLIWATMSVSMGEITEKNWREFYLRMLLDPYSPVNIYKDTGKTAVPEWHRIKIEDVFNHIGLTTNVTEKSRPKYLRELYQREERLHGKSFKQTEEGEGQDEV